MINVEPYIEKLELLKEYMDIVIDGYGSVFSINIDAIPAMNIEQLLRTYFETGLLFCNNDEQPTVNKLSFEEWLVIAPNRKYNPMPEVDRITWSNPIKNNQS